MQRLASLGLLAVALVSAASCSSKPSVTATSKTDGGGGGGAGGAVSLDPTFTNVWKQVIVKTGNCVGPQCHGAGVGGGLRMDSKGLAYRALVGVPAAGPCVDAGADAARRCGCGNSGKTRVVANKPDESLLIEKLSGNPTCGDPMPPTGEPIPPDLLDLVRQWITNGAKND